MSTLPCIVPDWPAPARVCAATTVRTGGVSTGPFSSLNLGSHVGDDAQAVRENRRRVREGLALPSEPVWLNQVHGAQVYRADEPPDESAPPTADSAVTQRAGIVCAVLTADCLPVLFCDRAGTCVAAAHAGWRGLAGGVLGEAVRALRVAPAQLIAWLGPAIEPEAFEVGDDVRAAFLKLHPQHALAFTPNERGRWQADLYQLARAELARLGVRDVYGGGFRCWADQARFFSYRRDGQTGRMASLVWLV